MRGKTNMSSQPSIRCHRDLGVYQDKVKELAVELPASPSGYPAMSRGGRQPVVGLSSSFPGSAARLATRSIWAPFVIAQNDHVWHKFDKAARRRYNDGSKGVYRPFTHKERTIKPWHSLPLSEAVQAQADFITSRIASTHRRISFGRTKPSAPSSSPKLNW